MLTNYSTKTLRYGMTTLAALMLLFPVSSSIAANDEGGRGTVKEQWGDLLHYINIARPKLAKSYAEALRDNEKVSPKQIYLLSVERPDSLKTLQKGANLEGLKDTVEKLRAKIEEGYKSWRSDPKQIEESIQMMSRSLRGYVIGKRRLKESGQYAIPLLIQALMDDKTPKLLKERIITMLHELGRNAVRAYSVGLQSRDLQLVGFLANALRQIEYPSALPRLREALKRPKLKNPDNPTRKIIVAAIIACAGGDRSALKKSPAELFYGLAEKYYDRADSLLPDNDVEGARAFVWFWKEGTGLIARPVPAPILCDIYAMRMSRLALKHDPAFYPAVALWLSACIRREIDLPKGTTDPLWSKDMPKADFYALASSPRYLQMVLARALENSNVDIARRVIETMGVNTGAKALVKPISGGAQPLVSAMGYPDRNVRFLAAQTLALARPTKKFHGYQVVMSL
ncbi:MAG: hypothetical protein KAJ01_07990, partial [Candidatus Hydrogenedentes bacterium]|nr:hypothetical protein [Candidatus Hydrogenedentota bacterium]